MKHAKVWGEAPTRIENLYRKKNMTLAEIGSLFGCADTTIMRFMDEHNIPRRTKSQVMKDRWRNFRREIPIEEIEQLYWDEGKTIHEIAESFGFSSSFIDNLMIRHEIPRRDPSDYRKGHSLSSEHRHKISQALKNVTHDGLFKEGEEPWNKGKQLSREYRRKLSLARKKFLRENPEHVKQLIKQANAKPNQSELKLLRILRKLSRKWRYVGNGELIIDGKCPDFWDGDINLVELYGDFYHEGDNPDDRIVFFEKRGYNCAVLWSSELQQIKSPEDVMEFLEGINLCGENE